MRRVAIVVGVMLLVSVGALAGESGDMKNFVAGNVAPFTMKLKDLDGSYLRFSTSYLYTGGWLMSMQRYGGEVGAPAYTQGRTVKIGNEDYLIAYTVETSGGDPNVMMYGRSDPNAPEPEPVTENSILSLALMGERGITTMMKVRPFNLAAELADYQRYLERYHEMITSRNAMNQPVAMQAVPDNMQKVAMALDMFTGDHDGVLPQMDKPEEFRKALDDYVESADVFIDADTNEFYGINPTLSNKKIADIKDPAQTIAVYQVKPGKDKKYGVILADFTIRRLTAIEFLKAKSNIP